MDGISCLREAISVVPVPGAPPRLSRDGAVVGLAFLDAALRLNHVRRLTERLSLVEHRIAHRITEVDISLNMLDRGQRAAARLFQQLVSHAIEDAEPNSTYERTLWVPVARVSRRTAEPVDVRDAAGNRVPRLTQYETSRLMASGLYRLFREILMSHPDSSDTSSDLHDVLSRIHEPRWLIQAALLTLFTERSRPESPAGRRRTPGTVDGHVRQYRDMALNVLDRYGPYLKDYSALLDVALNDHLVVVALDAAIDEHLLTYETPMYVNERAGLPQRVWRAFRASGEGYYVQYWTSVPSTLRSYHLIFDSSPGVDIGPLYLATNADAKAVESLRTDLAQLADRSDSQRRPPGGESAKKLLELEAQTALRKVAELLRRREWEASHARIALPGQYLRACAELAQAAVAGEATVGEDDRIKNSIVHHPSFSAGNLRAAAAELAGLEMSYDLALENEPLSSRAHAYWRRAPERSVNASQIRIRAGAVLREATGAGPRDALLYAGTLAVTAYLMGCFLTRSFWPYWGSAHQNVPLIRSNAEAVVAVLLVVPGFLYTRLTIPDPHSISGHLRAIPRIVVRFSISTMLAVAAAIAAYSELRVVRTGFILATLLPLLSTVFLLRRRPYAKTKALGRSGAPRWVAHSKPGKANGTPPDVRFSSAGGSGDEQDASSSTRDLADLARAGCEILRQPFTHVDFEVHHTIDRPGYMHDHLFGSPDPALSEQAGSDSATMAIEALVSAANGIGLVIGINTGSDVPGRDRRHGTPATLIIDEPDRRVFKGSSLPNPTFLYESAQTFEAMVSVEVAPRSIKFGQSIAVRDLIKEISRIAATVADAPLTFLQIPAQVPAQSFIGQDVRNAEITIAKRSSSLAVRFAMALRHPSAELRFRLTDLLIRYCTDKGFGLWLADSRIGYRSGNWFQICAHADDLPRRDRRDRAVSADWHAVEACLPVTFIGPARTGATYAIVSFLSQFGDIGIASGSITTLDDLAFIHLRLALSGFRRSNLHELNARLAGHGSGFASPTDALLVVHNELACTEDMASDRVLESDLGKQAGDYQTLLGPMLGCTVPERQRRIAVWFSWQIESAVEDLAVPLNQLFAAFADLGLGPGDGTAPDPTAEAPNLEYLICRDIGNYVLRGRGKLSISEADMLTLVGSHERETAPSRLCVSLENAWKTSLRRRGARGVSELTVAWREWWLGHWASPI